MERHEGAVKKGRDRTTRGTGIEEAEERIAVCSLQENQLRIRLEQWEWQKTGDIRDAERKQTPAAQVKFFREVL